MLVVNRHQKTVDVTDEHGEELLQGTEGFRLATQAEAEEYHKAVARTHPRYLARVNARRVELEAEKNAELDRLIDAELDEEAAEAAKSGAESWKNPGKAAKVEQPKAAIKAVNPDDLELDDEAIKASIEDNNDDDPELDELDLENEADAEKDPAKAPAPKKSKPVGKRRRK